jgi:hypothetical protein
MMARRTLTEGAPVAGMNNASVEGGAVGCVIAPWAARAEVTPRLA